MAENKYYETGFPYRKDKKLPGKLIVVEGTDGVGRSTQVELLKKDLEKIMKNIKKSLKNLQVLMH